MTADVLNEPDEERRTRRRSSDITTGLIFVTLGLAFLGQRFDLTPEINMHRSWPAFLLIPGLVIWLMHSSSGWFGRGLWWILCSGIFFLHTYNILSLRDSWPLFIALGGVSILLGSGYRRRRDRRGRRFES